MYVQNAEWFACKRLHWIIIYRLSSIFQIAVFVKKQLMDEQKYIEEEQNEDLNYLLWNKVMI
jgi:hypothetical protein